MLGALGGNVFPVLEKLYLSGNRRMSGYLVLAALAEWKAQGVKMGYLGLEGLGLKEDMKQAIEAISVGAKIMY